MKSVKIRHFLICLLAMFCCTGCMEQAAIVTAAGSATMAGLENDLAKSKERIIAEKVVLQEQLAQAQSQTIIDDLQAQIKALDKKQSTVETLQAGTNLARQGLSTDWTNPEASAPWLMAALTTGLAYMQRKEKKTIAQTLNNYQKSVNDYMAESAPIEAMALKNKLKGA